MESHEHNTVTPVAITVFALITTYGGQEYLVGLDKAHRVAIPGGKRDDGEWDLYHEILARELEEELGATLDPQKFTDPRFHLHLMLAHAKPLVFCTDVATEAYVKNPLAHVRNNGEVKLRVIFRMFEVSGSSPVEVDSREMQSPRYQSPGRRVPTRMAVRIALDFANSSGIWKHLNAPKLKCPVEPSLGHIRKRLNQLKICKAYVNGFTRNKTGRSSSPQPQQVAA